MKAGSNILLIAGLYCLAISPADAEQAVATAADDGPTSTAASSTASGASLVRLEDPQASASPATGWQLAAVPYFWMAGLKGDIGVSEEVEPVAADLSFFDIMDALKFALMGRFEARNGRFVGTADMIYLSMGGSDDVEIREVDFLEVELGSKTFISTLTAGYRAVDRDRMFVDVFAGGRITSMKTSLDLEGPQRSFSGSKTETWVDPVIGGRFQAPLGQDWSVQTYADMGGFGVGSDISWQLMGVVQFDLSKRWSLSAGWRHLEIDYDHDGFLFDAAMDGPILGAVYRF